MARKDERFEKNKKKVIPQNQLKNLPWLPGFFKPLETNLLDTDAPDHTRVRALTHKAFTPHLVEKMRERIQVLANDLLDAAERKGNVDLIRDYALPLPLTIIGEILGVPAADRPKFHRLTKAIVAAETNPNLLTIMPNLWSFLRYLRRLFKERRANPTDDLVTALVQAEEAGDKLSEDELLSMVFVLIVAGHETTVNLIGSGMLALMEHPDQLAKLRANPTLIQPATEELLRYVNPVETATERYAGEDLTIAGTPIARGELVLAVIASANRDENYFSNPDDLALEPHNNTHLAFRHAVHYCAGA